LTVMMNLSVLLLVSGVLAAGQRDQDQGLLIYDQRLIE
jgi:roadblock/LC7 domain-containing protein